MTLRPVDPALLVRGTEDDPRLGRAVVNVSVDGSIDGSLADGLKADVAIIGCADDTGIAHSGGRVGAAFGPAEIRRWLYRQTLGMDGALAELTLVDLGDVLPGATIDETHAAVEQAVSRAFDRAGVVLFLGGGHDLAFASQSALFERRTGRGVVVNLDTHLDVRPLKEGRIVTSGTPFRRLRERFDARVKLLELGIQPQHNALGHATWLRANDGRIVTLEELRAAPGVDERMKRELLAALAGADFGSVSLDLDVASAAVAPGTSAPPADGLDPAALAAFCELAGAQPKVRLVDVMELSPPHDENGRTARLAALCLWRFLVGWSARP
jgi:formiminoglutamase